MSLPDAFSFEFDGLDCFPGEEAQALKDASAIEHLEMPEDQSEIEILKTLTLSEHATQREASFYCLARVIRDIGMGCIQTNEELIAERSKDFDTLELIFVTDTINLLSAPGTTFEIQRSAAQVLCSLCRQEWLTKYCTDVKQITIIQKIASMLLLGCKTLICRVLQTNEPDELLLEWTQMQDNIIEAMEVLAKIATTDCVAKFAGEAADRCGALEDALTRHCSVMVMGAMLRARVVDAQLVNDRYLSNALVACQDTSFRVRDTMCRQIYALCCCVGDEQAREVILPELLELMKDEKRQVRDQALEALSNVVDVIKPEVVKSTILPVIRELAETMENEAVSDRLFENSEGTESLARAIGPFLYNSVQRNVLSCDDDEFLYFMTQFGKWCMPESDLDVRRACAHNFPGIVKTISARQYGKLLSDSYHSLCCDENDQVRRTCALSLHEIAKMLGKKRSRLYLLSNLLLLMNDACHDVQNALSFELAGIFNMFVDGEKTGENEEEEEEADEDEEKEDVILPKPNSADQQSITKPGDEGRPTEQVSFSNLLLPLSYMLAGNERAQSDWRYHLRLVETLPSVFPHFNESAACGALVPPMLVLLKEGAAPVRQAASETICFMIKHVSNPNKRGDILQRLVKQCQLHKNGQVRLIFIQIIRIVLRDFSRDFYRENFFSYSLELFEDQLAAVRLAMCGLVLDIRRACRLPEDERLLIRLRRSFEQRLANDSDPQVKKAVTQAAHMLEATWDPFSIGDMQDVERNINTNINKSILGPVEESDDVIHTADPGTCAKRKLKYFESENRKVAEEQAVWGTEATSWVVRRTSSLTLNSNAIHDLRSTSQHGIATTVQGGISVINPTSFSAGASHGTAGGFTLPPVSVSVSGVGQRTRVNAQRSGPISRQVQNMSSSSFSSSSATSVSGDKPPRSPARATRSPRSPRRPVRKNRI